MNPYSNDVRYYPAKICLQYSYEFDLNKCQSKFRFRPAVHFVDLLKQFKKDLLSTVNHGRNVIKVNKWIQSRQCHCNPDQCSGGGLLYDNTLTILNVLLTTNAVQCLAVSSVPFHLKSRYKGKLATFFHLQFIAQRFPFDFLSSYTPMKKISQGSKKPT